MEELIYRIIDNYSGSIEPITMPTKEELEQIALLRVMDQGEILEDVGYKMIVPSRTKCIFYLFPDKED